MNLASAQLYNDAFTADPSLANDPEHDYRYAAARAAALAGAGQGKDAVGLSTADRKRWRSRSLAWLSADLDTMTHSANDKASESTTLTSWRNDPDLSFVRDPVKLQMLDPQEQDQWSALWKQVDSQIAPAADAK